MESYQDMVNVGISHLPKEVIVTERFEIPKAKGHIQGNKTVITNFNLIIGSFRRDRDHFLKFLLKELATPGFFDGPRLVFGRKVSATLINQKINQYASLYVLCSKCGKPDTQILTREDGTYLKCASCGEQLPLKL